MPREQLDEGGASVLGWSLFGIVVCLLAIFWFAFTYTVEPNERTVRVRFGNISEVLMPGLYVRFPTIDSMYDYPSDNLRISNPQNRANTYTVDNQEIDVVYTLIYQLPSDDQGLRFIHANAQNYKTQIEGVVIDRMKRALGKVNSNSVAKERGAIVDTIQKDLTEILLGLYRIKVISFQLNDIAFNKAFIDAVTGSSVEKAKVEKEAQILEQKKLIAQQVEAEAKGRADAERLRLSAEAYGKEANGLAEAKAIEAQALALAKNPALVDLEKARRWTGVLPLNLYGSAPLPMLDVTREKR